MKKILLAAFFIPLASVAGFEITEEEILDQLMKFFKEDHFKNLSLRQTTVAIFDKKKEARPFRFSLYPSISKNTLEKDVATPMPTFNTSDIKIKTVAKNGTYKINNLYFINTLGQEIDTLSMVSMPSFGSFEDAIEKNSQHDNMASPGMEKQLALLKKLTQKSPNSLNNIEEIKEQ